MFLRRTLAACGLGLLAGTACADDKPSFADAGTVVSMPGGVATATVLPYAPSCMPTPPPLGLPPCGPAKKMAAGGCGGDGCAAWPTERFSGPTASWTGLDGSCGAAGKGCGGSDHGGCLQKVLNWLSYKGGDYKVSAAPTPYHPPLWVGFPCHDRTVTGKPNAGCDGPAAGSCATGSCGVPARGAHHCPTKISTGECTPVLRTGPYGASPEPSASPWAVEPSWGRPAMPAVPPAPPKEPPPGPRKAEGGVSFTPGSAPTAEPTVTGVALYPK